MTIGAILGSKGREVISVTSETPVSEAVQLFAARRIGAVPVVDGGRVVGIFSERDVIYSLAKVGPSSLEGRVGDVMTSPVESVAPDHAVLGALSLMTRRRIRHLPVVDGAAIIGFVSIGDLVKYRIDKIESEAAALREYIAS